jgi:hypothetical protein
LVGCRNFEVQSESKNVPSRVTSGPNDAVRFEIGGKQISPEEISANVLRKLADDASRYIGEKVTDAVITASGGAESNTPPPGSDDAIDAEFRPSEYNGADLG